MKVYLKIIFCLLLIMGIAQINLAQAIAQEEEAVAPSEPLAEQISGSITSIDLENSSLVIKQLKDKDNQIYEDVTIYLDNVTAIEKDNQAAAISGLTVGEQATIQYVTDSEGKNIATYIGIESKQQ